MINYQRQTDFFNPDNPQHQVPVLIVGAGTIGSWTILGLTKLGVREIVVVDFDKVETQNIPNQLFGNFQVGEPKGKSISTFIVPFTEIEPSWFDGTFAEYLEQFTPEGGRPFILIGAVDNMDARKQIFDFAKSHPASVVKYIDGRMGGEVMKIYSIDPKSQDDIQFYETDLAENMVKVENEEAARLSAVPCTAKSVVDVAMIIAGRITNAVRNTITGKNLIPRYFIECPSQNLKQGE